MNFHRLGWLGMVVCLAWVSGAEAAGKKKPVFPPDDAPGEDRNWVAMHLYDSIYPMTDTQTFPESLASLEIMNQLMTKRSILRDLASKLGHKDDGTGTRSREGHYMIWIHLSDRAIARYGITRDALPEFAWMFKDRQTDAFTAWSGDTNLVAFLREGVKGLGKPVRYENGQLTGNFQGFADAVRQGEADYEGGWYVSDEQALKLVQSVSTYPGRDKGYSFLRSIEEYPNAPYEPKNAQLVNGYNCGDFAFYAITSSGVIPRAEVEAFKVQFWYPKVYFDHVLPLKGVGAKGAKWLEANPNASVFPGNVMTKLGWAPLLFEPGGLEFFDKGAIAERVRHDWTDLSMGRIWDQAHAIAWLKQRQDFRSKGIITELKHAVDTGARIYSPVRQVPETPENRFTLSREFAKLQKRGDRHMAVKMEDAGLAGLDGEDFRILWSHLKDSFWDDNAGAPH